MNIGERVVKIEHESHNLEISNYLGALSLLLTEPHAQGSCFCRLAALLQKGQNFV